MDGIFFVPEGAFGLRTGCQWNAMNTTGICSSSTPCQMGSSTAHLRFQEWTAVGLPAKSPPAKSWRAGWQAGVFEKLWALSLEDYDGLKGLD